MLKLSVLMITKNAGELLSQVLASINGLASEIVIIDDSSSDSTIKIAREYKARILINNEYDLGKQRSYGLTCVKNDWILVLDSDEVVSRKLLIELKGILMNKSNYKGYLVPFQNHFLGREINFGGENYKKLIFFNKNFVRSDSAFIHEKYILKSGTAGVLHEKIYHYSYRNLFQIFVKFTDYAVRDAKQRRKNNEKTSFKKIFLYPLHMFWARFVEDKGYKDGLFRIPLDIGFAYMEFLTYFLMIFI